MREQAPRRGDVAVAIAWQAAAWPADLIVLARRPWPAITRLPGGCVPEQVTRKDSCPPSRLTDALEVLPGDRLAGVLAHVAARPDRIPRLHALVLSHGHPDPHADARRR